MESLLAAALLIAMPADLAQSTPQQTPPPGQQPVQIPVETPQPEANPDQPSLTCPPGQFPSAFSDVFPTDWAYQAVIRLSSQPIECFSFPTDNSNR